jgi:arginyl-tRNA synthetase
MNLYAHYRAAIVAAVERLASAGALPARLDTARIAVEPPRDPAHGDLACNAAMILAKPAGLAPRKLAELLVAELIKLAGVEDAAIAGPGFINLRLKPDLWRERIRDVLDQGLAFGASTIGKGEPINVEFVSANPTGMLHVGHMRGAIVGDVLASLLAKAGYSVTREYYVNDAGKQVETLADSALMRIRQKMGEQIAESAFEGFYPGEEVAASAQAFLDEWIVPAGSHPSENLMPSKDKVREAVVDDWIVPAGSRPSENLMLSKDKVREAVVSDMMRLIREDLAALGIRHDVFTSERELVESGAVDAALAELDRRGHIYVGTLEPPKGKPVEDWEPRPQTLFRSTAFGDDVDRPLRKSDGSWTYFASDIAYHRDKFQRGFRTMIDIWGADHGGYIKRVAAAIAALTDGQGALDVKVCQIVNLMERGQPVKMSKRAGNVVTVRDVLDRVGKDVMRFIMLTRKNDAPLDFDFAKAQEQSKDNPVFYVQYAHARCCSVFRQAAETMPGLATGDGALSAAALDRLADPGEFGLVKILAQWPRIVEAAAEAHEPHRVAFYLYDLAAAFHVHWNRGKETPTLRFIVEGDEALTLARLAMVRAAQLVIASGLQVMGVAPLEAMR